MRPLFCLIGIAACSSPSIRVVTDAPAEVDRVAAIVLNERGQLIGATGLLRREEAAQSQLASLSDERDEIRTVLLVGYSDEALARAAGGTLPSERILALNPLRPAGVSLPTLPAPNWQVEGDGGAAATIAPGESTRTVALTASWMPPCPTLVPADRPVTLLSCEGEYCGATFRQEGCEIQAELEGCIEGGPTRLFVGSRGELSGVGSAGDCSPSPSPPGAAFSFSCQQCRVDGFVPPYTVQFEASAAVQVEPVSDPQGRLAADTDVTKGYVLGVAPLSTPRSACRYAEPRVVALTRSEPGQCQGEASLVVVSSATLEVLGRGSLGSRCVRGLAADPGGDGVLVISDKPGTLTRVDCDLQVVESVPYGPGVDADAIGAAIEVVPRAAGAPRVVVGVQAYGGAGLPLENGNLLEFDPLALGPPRVHRLVGYGFVGNLATMGPELLLASAVSSDLDANLAVGLVDLSQDPIRTQFGAGPWGSQLPQHFEGLAALSRKGQVLWASAPHQDDPIQTSVLRIGAAGATADIEMFDYMRGDTDLTGVHVWRAAPAAENEDRYAIVASTVRDPSLPPDTRVGLVDLDARRLDRGRLKIGFGPVGVIREDEDGALWLPLLWQGAIVRVRPAAPKQVFE